MSVKWNPLLTTFFVAFVMSSMLPERTGADEVDRLVSLSKSGNCMATDHVRSKARFTGRELSRALKYVEAHPDCTSYHLVFSLCEYHPREYSKIDPETRAAVLASAMVNLPMNDWGILDPVTTVDRDAAKLFLGLGSHALRQLLPILDNKSPAPCFGSEIGTDSYREQHRRCDYAYRYGMLLLGQKPRFDRDIAARDKDIASLKKRLKEHGIEPPRRPAKWMELPSRDSAITPEEKRLQ